MLSWIKSLPAWAWGLLAGVLALFFGRKILFPSHPKPIGGPGPIPSKRAEEAREKIKEDAQEERSEIDKRFDKAEKDWLEKFGNNGGKP